MPPKSTTPKAPKAPKEPKVKKVVRETTTHYSNGTTVKTKSTKKGTK